MEEIACTGVKQVEMWLANNSFINLFNASDQTGGQDIGANGSVEDILVHVETVLQPNVPVKIGDEGSIKLKEKANLLGRKAYVAYLVIDSNKNLVGEICWQRLN